MNSRQELTFKHNLRRGRHGWLRLTPAYSIQLVNEILSSIPRPSYVLEPFSGTGTTGLVCGEHGIDCDLIDINPFLIWFAKTKTANYSTDELLTARVYLRSVVEQVCSDNRVDLWTPAIKNIDRWWAKDRQILLARLREAIIQVPDQTAQDLLKIPFCQMLIEWSNAAFNHQSMSFKDVVEVKTLPLYAGPTLIEQFEAAALNTLEAAASLVMGRIQVIEADSRSVPAPQAGQYDCVITSPPYPNRMSYIRELRPYMYWLGYLNEARDAGEIDWKAIGGTWGIATSRVGKWTPPGEDVAYSDFKEILGGIASKSDVLARYVHKYFVDMTDHFNALVPLLAQNARVFYIVGNSKFYDTLVPVEEIYASLLRNAGFSHVRVEPIRKRNSKKELYEYVVSGQKL